MHVFFNVIVVLQMLTALVMIGLVLVQHGKGADMGASFGSGASGSLFGATGSANFLSRPLRKARFRFPARHPRRRHLHRRQRCLHQPHRYPPHRALARFQPSRPGPPAGVAAMPQNRPGGSALRVE